MPKRTVVEPSVEETKAVAEVQQKPKTGTLEYYAFICNSPEFNKDANKKQIEKIREWNKEATRIASSLRKVLSEKYPATSIEVSSEPFKNVTEAVGLEFWEHRNYISHEKFIVNIATNFKKVFYLGEYENINHFKSDIYNQCIMELEKVRS